MKRQTIHTKVTLTREQTPNLKCITGSAKLEGRAWRVTARREGPTFWEGGAFDTRLATPGGPSGGVTHQGVSPISDS